VDINCIILAGGKGTRLGRDKAFEIIDDSLILQKVIRKVSFAKDIILVTGSKLKYFPGLVDSPQIKMIPDALPGKGPLGGIYSGLAVSDETYNLVVACDMPFLNGDLIDYMVSAISGYDAVIPRPKGMLEPLHAIYHRRCMEPIRNKLMDGKLDIHKIFDRLNTRYIEEDEIGRFDPGHLSFFNVNTEADLNAAREVSHKVPDD
jgi:molybdenum cofactor guanylyltransferase